MFICDDVLFVQCAHLQAFIKYLSFRYNLLNTNEL